MRHALWTLVVTAQSGGTDFVFFDLYNGSDRDITVSSVVVVKAGNSLLDDSIRFLLYRTTSVGSGGLEAEQDAIFSSLVTITRLQQVALPSGISARRAPTDGADLGPLIALRTVYSEQSHPANYEPLEFVNALLTVPQGTGIQVRQYTSELVGGSQSFEVLFY